jgi:hypothetical protein
VFNSFRGRHSLQGPSVEASDPQAMIATKGRLRGVRIIIAPVTKWLAFATGVINAREFRKDVVRQMRLTVTNLNPEITIGATDRTGRYTEIHLHFGEYRLRITRATYNPRLRDLWADIGSVSEPAAFFRMDYVMMALKRLDNPGEKIESSGTSESLNALACLMQPYGPCILS